MSYNLISRPHTKSYDAVTFMSAFLCNNSTYTAYSIQSHNATCDQYTVYMLLLKLLYFTASKFFSSISISHQYQCISISMWSKHSIPGTAATWPWNPMPMTCTFFAGLQHTSTVLELMICFSAALGFEGGSRLLTLKLIHHADHITTYAQFVEDCECEWSQRTRSKPAKIELQYNLQWWWLFLVAAVVVVVVVVVGGVVEG